MDVRNLVRTVLTEEDADFVAFMLKRMVVDKKFTGKEISCEIWTTDIPEIKTHFEVKRKTA